MTLPYQGIRMVDFTQVQQGPSATQVLADYGMDVIKVERINDGEIGRRNPPRVNGISAYFLANNRNKRTISLDLRRPEAKEIIYKMVKVSDIVASNFRPGVMDRMGFGYEELDKINPRIIWAVATGFGSSGPYEKRIGQDLLAQALGGMISLTGDRESPPRPAGTFIADFLGGMLFAQGMMAALAAREQTGRGQIVDSCLLNGMIVSHIQENAAVLNLGKEYPRPHPAGGHSANGALYAIYECKDGKYFAMMGSFAENVLGRVCQALEIEPSLADDPRWKDVDLRSEETWGFYPVLKAGFKKFDRDEVELRFLEYDLPPGPVHNLQEVFEDPQVIHNEMIVDMEHSIYGPIKLTGFPVKLSDTPATLRLPPPTVGEHNEEVLRELNYTDDEIRALQREGVVGSENARRAALDLIGEGI